MNCFGLLFCKQSFIISLKLCKTLSRILWFRILAFLIKFENLAHFGKELLLLNAFYFSILFLFYLK